MEDVLDRKIPFMVVFGEDEIAAGTVNLKTMADKSQETVKLEDLVEVLKTKGCRLVTDVSGSIFEKF